MFPPSVGFASQNGFSYKAGFSASAAAASVHADMPLAVLRSHSKADLGFSRTVVSITHRGNSRNDRALVFSAIAKMVDNKATPVPNTWMSVASTPVSEDLIGVMSCNQQVLTYSPEVEKRFRAISSNMFMDEEKNMWTLKETDGGKLWIRTTAYDDEKVLEELLCSRSSATANNRYDYHHPVVDAEFKVNVSGGDYVAYVSKSSSDSFSSGFIASLVQDKDGKVLREVVVVGRNKDSYEIIDRNMILCTCSTDDTSGLANPDFSSTASNLRSNVNLDDILAYYRALFVRNSEYFAKFEERIRARFYG